MPSTPLEVLFTGRQEDPAMSVVVVPQEPPACPDDGVVVAVKARPINPADLLMLEDRHVYRPTLPAHVGIEGAGVVVEAGPRSRHTPGTLVAIPQGGTWRDLLALPDDGVLPLPPGTDLAQASMLCVNPFTAVGMLEGLSAGATILVNAGHSAIATIVFAVARQRGVNAIAVVREGRPNVPGAYATLEDGPDLARRVSTLAPSPVALALDAVAGAGSARMFDAVGDGGALVIYGLLASETVELPAAGVVFRDVTVRGFARLRAFRGMSAERRAAITAELLELVASGQLSTAVEATYPLEDVASAVRHHLRPGRSGKILLVS